MDPATWINTADGPCVVSTEWGIDNIDPMLTKAKALGYKIKKKAI